MRGWTGWSSIPPVWADPGDRAGAGDGHGRVRRFSRPSGVLCLPAGLTGLEFAHGIPGTVGGGLTMNAGAYGGELRQVVRQVRVLVPEEGIRPFPGRRWPSATAAVF
ncbi:MAG: hypothetical protein V8R55_01120 [Dysosmobacter sp.]